MLLVLLTFCVIYLLKLKFLSTSTPFLLLTFPIQPLPLHCYISVATFVLHPHKCKVMTVSNKTKLENKSSDTYITMKGKRLNWKCQKENKYVDAFTHSGMSFMYIANSMGPSTLPCGMPLVLWILRHF
jgi:hypothetical protein